MSVPSDSLTWASGALHVFVEETHWSYACSCFHLHVTLIWDWTGPAAPDSRPQKALTKTPVRRNDGGHREVIVWGKPDGRGVSSVAEGRRHQR